VSWAKTLPAGTGCQRPGSGRASFLEAVYGEAIYAPVLRFHIYEDTRVNPGIIPGWN